MGKLKKKCVKKLLSASQNYDLDLYWFGGTYTCAGLWLQ